MPKSREVAIRLSIIASALAIMLYAILLTTAQLQEPQAITKYLTDPQEEVTFNIHIPFAINVLNIVSTSGNLNITYSPAIEIPSGVIFPNQTENLGITFSGSEMQISISIPRITLIKGITLSGGNFSTNINALGTYSVPLGYLLAFASGASGFNIPSIPLYINFTAEISGVLAVTGDVAHPISEPITFNQPTTIPITITAENVPNGTITITLSNISYSITISAIYIVLPSILSYIFGTNEINFINEPITLANVKGQPNSISSTIIIKPYLVTFIEQGLPSGTAWSVTLNGVTRTSTTNEVTFEVPAGTFSYTVSSVPGYMASPSSGAVTVTDSNVTQTINFKQVHSTVSVIIPPRVTTTTITITTSTVSYNSLEVMEASAIIITAAVIAALIILLTAIHRRR